MIEMKHCPKCGSTNVDFLVFYRPSTWKCLDCGYEGAFIIEGNYPLREKQRSYRENRRIIAWVDGRRQAEDHGSLGVSQKEDGDTD